MSTRRQYRKRDATDVVAVQLALDTEGFVYRKWGGQQTCKSGDWLVDNGREVYTVDAETFAATYRMQSRGIYRKVAPVWAECAESAGSVQTKEGVTHYEAGDFLVFNNSDGGDAYAVERAEFERLYVAAE